MDRLLPNGGGVGLDDAGVRQRTGGSAPVTAVVLAATLRADLLAAVRRVIQLLVLSPEGMNITALVADLVHDPALAQQFRDQILRPRRLIAAGIVRRAVDRVELPLDVDIELLLDVYAGAV